MHGRGSIVSSTLRLLHGPSRVRVTITITITCCLVATCPVLLAALQALAGAVAQEQQRRQCAAAGAAEQALEQQCQPVLDKLAARLQRGAAQQPLLPAQEAAALLERVKQQLVLGERLAQQLGGMRCEQLEFVCRGCTVQVVEVSGDVMASVRCTATKQPFTRCV